MRRVKVTVLTAVVIAIFSATTGLAQAPKPKRSCDEVRSQGATLLDLTARASSLDERLAFLKPASDAALALNLCRQEDFQHRNIVMVNMDADIESQLSAFMYDQAADLARQTAKTVCH
jgi:hypothetical protein